MNKTKATLLVALTAAAMTVIPQTTYAGHRGDKVAAAIGGLIGGIIIGQNIERNREPAPARCEQPAPRVVVVQNDCPPPPAGYWREVSTSVWIPGQFVIRYDDRGYQVKTYEPGHYTYRTTREWVPYDRIDCDQGPYYARR